MESNKMSAMAMIAVILGAVGLGTGVYSVISMQSGAVKGEDGDDGDDGSIGIIGPPGPVGILVGILSPDESNCVWGNTTIDALVYSSKSYSVSVLLNGTQIGSVLPFVWNASKVEQGWWNITVKATDTSNNVGKDSVRVLVYNYTHSGVKRTWFNTDGTQETLNDQADKIMNELVIWFEVNSDESVYLHYTARGIISWTISGGAGQIMVWIAIDDVKVGMFVTYHNYHTTIPLDWYFGIANQYSTSLSPGIHNATIIAWSDYPPDGSCKIDGQTLLVQTYIP